VDADSERSNLGEIEPQSTVQNMTLAHRTSLRVAALATACLLGACNALPTNHVSRGDVRLGQGGEAIGKFTSQGVDRLFVALTNRGPGEVQFTVTDDQGRTLDSGAIGRTERSFTWRPLESYVTLVLRAPTKPASVQYRVASESAFGVEWNLSRAQPRNP